jgi:ribose/xylose/arabinose/galactoside ABC-type transport system permease subunit
MAVGMTMVLITGGIDVSTASQMMLSSMVVAYFVFSPVANVFTVIVLAIATGFATGAINGSLIAVFNIPPLIITLGTSSAIRGLIMLITDGKWVINLPDWFRAIGKPESGLPMTIIYAVLIFIIMSVVLRNTSFGRAIYAVGGNPEAAKRSGIIPGKIIFWTYSCCGVLCGISGLLINTILYNYQPTSGLGLEMSAIAASVIGGANILGGSGTLIGTAFGVILMGVIENGLVVAHVPTYYQKLVYGLIIIVTISLDVLRKRRSEDTSNLVDVV